MADPSIGKLTVQEIIDGGGGEVLNFEIISSIMHSTGGWGFNLDLNSEDFLL